MSECCAHFWNLGHAGKIAHALWLGRFGRVAATGQKQHSTSVSQQAEGWRAEYRNVRDTGKFTLTRVTREPSVAAVSVDVDVDPNPRTGGVRRWWWCWCQRRWCDGQGDPVPMEEIGPPTLAKLRVEKGKRRCMGPGFNGAHSVEAVSAWRWHFSGDQCCRRSSGMGSEESC